MFETLFTRKTLSLTLYSTIASLAAIWACFQIPLEAMPRESAENFLYLSVTATQPSSPRQMERTLAIPLEGAARTLSGLIGQRTNVNAQGATVSLTFSPGTDLDRATFDLYQAMQEMAQRGLVEPKQTKVTRLNPDAQAIIKFSLTGGLMPAELYTLVESEVRSTVESIPGVAKVEISGLDRQVRGWDLPTETLASLGIEPSKLAAQLDARATNLALGAWTSPQGVQIPLNASTPRAELAVLMEINIAPKGYVPLKQAAIPWRREATASPVTNKNGSKAIFLEIFTKDGADLFFLKARLRELAHRLQGMGVETDFLLDRVDDLRRSLLDVQEALLSSMILTGLIILLFLRKISPALVIASVIPLSTVWTILCMWALGKTLNLLTLSGLILSVGMVVDNGIVVVEKIQQLRREGVPKSFAAAQAARAMLWPLLISTLTNAAIFIPPSFVMAGDSFTDMLKAFRDPILISLATSLLAALFIIPLLSLWVPVWTPSEKPPRDYTPLFAFIRRRKMMLLAPIILAFAIISVPLSELPESDIETPRDPFVALRVRFTPDVTVEERSRYFKALEAYVLKANLPAKFVLAEFNPAYTNGGISFFPADGNDEAQLETLTGHVDKISSEYPTPAGMVLGDNFSITSKLTPKITMQFSTHDFSEFTILEQSLREHFSGSGFVADIKNDAQERDQFDAFFRLNHKRIIQTGISANMVAAAASARGRTWVDLAEITPQGPGTAVVWTKGESENWTQQEWTRLPIAVAPGKAKAQAGDLGQWEVTPQTSSLRRENSVYSAPLNFYLTPGRGRADAKAYLEAELAKFPFPPGQGLKIDKSAENIAQARANSYFIMGLSLLLIYLLLAAMFESLKIPIAIIVSVPLAVMCGLSGLWVMGMSIDPMARLGLVILTGIAVNNSIVLVDVIQEWRGLGHSRAEAVVRGCAQRLSAVLMSTACNVAGVLPVALGEGKIMGIPYSGMGVVIVAGLIGSTFVTLVLLPAVYEFLDGDQRQGTATISGTRSAPM